MLNEFLISGFSSYDNKTILLVLFLLVNAIVILLTFIDFKIFKKESLEKLIEELETELNGRILIIIDDTKMEKKKNFGSDLQSRILSIEDEYLESFFHYISDCVNKEKKIILIVFTEGGSVAFSDAVINAILNHPYGSQAYIPYYAMSAGAIISLACEDIYMNSFSFLTPVDPQIELEVKEKNIYCSAKSLSEIIKKNNKNQVDEQVYLQAFDSVSLFKDNLQTLSRIFRRRKISGAALKKLLYIFGSGEIPHSKPLSPSYLNSISAYLNIQSIENSRVDMLFRQFLLNINK